MHDRVHCHWRWQCHVPLLASFVIRIKVSLPNNAIGWLQRLPHLMPGDHFLSGNLNDKVLATSPCDPEDHLPAYLSWINGCSSCLGNYLAMLSQDMLHPCQLCVELRWGGYICWRCGCTKGPEQKIILPIITKVNLNIPHAYISIIIYYVISYGKLYPLLDVKCYISLHFIIMKLHVWYSKQSKANFVYRSMETAITYLNNLSSLISMSCLLIHASIAHSRVNLLFNPKKLATKGFSTVFCSIQCPE